MIGSQGSQGLDGVPGSDGHPGEDVSAAKSLLVCVFFFKVPADDVVVCRGLWESEA